MEKPSFSPNEAKSVYHKNLQKHDIFLERLADKLLKTRRITAIIKLYFPDGRGEEQSGGKGAERMAFYGGKNADEGGCAAGKQHGGVKGI
ncbi:MAG: hypothetical protein Q4C65_10270 [Eubacteriales bacterium]|nr:hypothetical protein [Eubacteriales bacterium]